MDFIETRSWDDQTIKIQASLPNQRGCFKRYCQGFVVFGRIWSRKKSGENVGKRVFYHQCSAKAYISKIGKESNQSHLWKCRAVVYYRHPRKKGLKTLKTNEKIEQGFNQNHTKSSMSEIEIDLVFNKEIISEGEGRPLNKCLILEDTRFNWESSSWCWISLVWRERLPSLIDSGRKIFMYRAASTAIAAET